MLNKIILALFIAAGAMLFYRSSLPRKAGPDPVLRPHISIAASPRFEIGVKEYSFEFDVQNVSEAAADEVRVSAFVAVNDRVTTAMNCIVGDPVLRAYLEEKAAPFAACTVVYSGPDLPGKNAGVCGFLRSDTIAPNAVLSRAITVPRKEFDEMMRSSDNGKNAVYVLVTYKAADSKKIFYTHLAFRPRPPFPPGGKTRKVSYSFSWPGMN